MNEKGCKFKQRIVSDVFKQHIMDCQLSCTSPLPWAWVLEILARSTQVDLSLLIGLVKKAPEASDGIFRNVRELVPLRILERIYVQEAHKTSASESSQKIVVDPSKRCEDFLHKVLPEVHNTSAWNFKAAGAEMSKWDMKPFIEHKRSTLTKCSLEQLKDAILTGHRPLVSLREQSGLPVGKQPKPKSHVDNGHYKGITNRPNRSDSITQMCAENDHLTSQVLAKSKYILHDNSPVKRKRSAPTENIEGKSCKDLDIWENSFEAIMKTVKMHKLYSISNEQDLCIDSISSRIDRQRTDVSLSAARQSEGERCRFGKEAYCGDVELRRLSVDHNNECISSKGEVLPCVKEVPHHSMEASIDLEDLNQLADTAKSVEDYNKRDNCSSKRKTCVGFKVQNGPPRDGDNEFISKRLVAHDIFPVEKPISHHVTEVPNNNSDERQRQYRDIEDLKCDNQGQRIKANQNLDKLDQNIQSNVPNADEAEKINGCGDNDRYHDEIADIARKESFLISQFTLSQDSLVDDWSDLNLCVKCSKSENVLACCSNSCPLVVHGSCLGSDVSFDEDGKFYCPFCAYSRAVSEYQEAKKKASTAKSILTVFIFPGSRKGTKKQPPRLCSTSQNYSKQVDGFPKSNDLTTKEKLDSEKAGPSGFHSGDCFPVRWKEVCSTDRTHETLSKHGQERRHKRLVTRSQRTVCQRQMDKQGILKSHNGKVLHEASETSDEHAEIRSKKGVSDPAETDLPCEHNCSSSAETADIEEIFEEEYKSSADAEEISEEIGNSRAPKNYKKVRKLERQPPYRGRGQRRRFLWTSEEEEKLREAVQVNYCPEDVNIRWRKILEYGAGTFHESRTAAQLKDKWRNLCKTMG